MISPPKTALVREAPSSIDYLLPVRWPQTNLALPLELAPAGSVIQQWSRRTKNIL
jgi:hypothetical protein